MNEPERLDTIERIATALQTQPQIVAEALWRLGRFGGAHPTSNVLTHTIALCNDPEIVAAGPDAVIWAALHDCHEIITGEIPRAFGKMIDDISYRQFILDHELLACLGLAIDNETMRFVTSRDHAIGSDEHSLWGAYPHTLMSKWEPQTISGWEWLGMIRDECIFEFVRVITRGLAR